MSAPTIASRCATFACGEQLGHGAHRGQECCEVGCDCDLTVPEPPVCIDCDGTGIGQGYRADGSLPTCATCGGRGY